MATLLLAMFGLAGCDGFAPWDFGRPAARAELRAVHTSAPDVAAHAAIRAYQILVSPNYFHRCQFSPHCSAYGLEAVDRQGFFFGSVMAVERILRCHPYAFLDRYPIVADWPSDPFGIFVLDFWDMATVSMRRSDPVRENILW